MFFQFGGGGGGMPFPGMGGMGGMHMGHDEDDEGPAGGKEVRKMIRRSTMTTFCCPPKIPLAVIDDLWRFAVHQCRLPC